MNTAQGNAVHVLRSHGRSFYFASHLLGRVFRHRAARLYAFCRYVDDLADEHTDAAQARREIVAVQRALLLGVSPHSAVQNLLNLRQEIGLPAAPLEVLLSGVQCDLGVTRLQNEAELVQYACKVAGTVGLMMCAVLEVHDTKARPFAVDLGIAMQLTNIARDVGEDAAKGRIYLPEAWTGGLSLEEILAPTPAQQVRLRTSIERTLALAKTYYDSGTSGLGYLPWGAQNGILVAARLYREIGQVLAQQGHRSWETRAMVSMPRKLMCTAAALPRQWLNAVWGSAPPTHRAPLHQHLRGYFGVSEAVSR